MLRSFFQILPSVHCPAFVVLQVTLQLEDVEDGNSGTSPRRAHGRKHLSRQQRNLNSRWDIQKLQAAQQAESWMWEATR